jgi:hypothetical protein
MNLIISAEFSAPPSETGAFRTLTMYATIMRHYDCLVEVGKEERDYYYKWLKNRYIYDYVKELVIVGEEKGIKIVYNLYNDRMTYNNLGQYIKLL